MMHDTDTPLGHAIDPETGEVVASLHTEEVLTEFQNHAYWKVDREYRVPDLDLVDRLHLQRQYNLFGREKVVEWLQANVAVPNRALLEDDFDEEAYYEHLVDCYVDAE